MSDPAGCAGDYPRTDTADTTCCDRCDLWVGLHVLRVVEVAARAGC